MKKITFALSAMTLLAASSASQAVIVYNDQFDGDLINAHVGGDFTSGTNNTSAREFIDEGELTSLTNDGSYVAWMHTDNQFALTPGFTLVVDFTTAGSGFPSFTSSFGIVDEITAALPTTPGNLNGFMQTDEALNAVGFSATERLGFQGLNSDFGTLASASTALNGAIALGTRQTFTLTVNADGSAAFDLDGTSGSLATGAFSDLFTNSTDGQFFFAAYSQGNAGLILHEVTIDVVPEPSSVSLLGLGALALSLRRRR